MSTQRTKKVASLIHQTIAIELASLMNTPKVTINAVDVSPDLRNATAWLGIISKDAAEKAKLLATAQYHRDAMQRAIASRLATKFIPRLQLKLDAGADHADRINHILHNS